MMDVVDVVLILPPPPSLNKLYAGKHWSYRKKAKDDYKKEIVRELEKLQPFTAEYIFMDIHYNSRYDVDNAILVSKFVADTLRERGIIADDNPKYYKKLKITFNQDMEKNTYKVTINCYNYGIL